MRTRAYVSVMVSVTHGVSSMTLQTLAMVLRQSVVFSSGRVLFCRGQSNTFTEPRATEDNLGIN